jgi:4-amino-4-deoxy-L-arabinose transferase-like glycosyltransferase
MARFVRWRGIGLDSAAPSALKLQIVERADGPAGVQPAKGQVPDAATAGLACSRQRRDAIALAAICGVALLVRLAFTQRVLVFVTKDSFEYFQPAYNLLNGLGFDLALRRPPVYPLFAAGAMAVLGQNLQALAFVQHLLGVVVTGLAYGVAAYIFGRAAGWVAGLLVAVNSPLLIYEHYVLSESLFTLLLLIACGATVWALRRQTRWSFVVAGLLLGLAILARPVAQSVLLTVPFAVLAVTGSVRRAIAPTLIILGVAALVIVPWMVRNKIVHGDLSTSGTGRFLSARVVKHDRGYVFYDPSMASGQGDTLAVRARKIFQDEADARPEEGPIYSRYRQELGLTEAQADAMLRDISIEGIRRDPGHYLQTTAQMFRDLFEGSQKEELLRWHYRERDQDRVSNQWDYMRDLLSLPSQAQSDEQGAAEAIGSIFRPTRWITPIVFLLLLAIVSCVRRPSHRPALFLALVVLTILLVSAALVGEVPRYRYPVDPLIAILVGGGAVQAARLLRWLPRRSAASALVERRA